MAQFFSGEVFLGASCPRDNYPCENHAKGNFPWGQLAKGKLPGVNYLRRNCPRVNYLEGNYPGRNNLGQLPGEKLSGGQSSRGQFSSGEIVQTTYNTISTSNFISTSNSTAILCNWFSALNHVFQTNIFRTVSKTSMYSLLFSL